MQSVDEALNRILTAFERLAAERVDLPDALDRVLAEDIVSEVDLPPFPNSSMDGFAVRAADVVEPGVELTVVGDVPAAAPPS
jgi:molybdopterin molybdotransferase